MRRVRELRQQRSLTLMVVPQCAFGPGPHGLLFQKYTGLLLSRGAAARLAGLRHVRCNHAIWMRTRLPVSPVDVARGPLSHVER